MNLKGMLRLERLMRLVLVAGVVGLVWCGLGVAAEDGDGEIFESEGHQG